MTPRARARLFLLIAFTIGALFVQLKAQTEVGANIRFAEPTSGRCRIAPGTTTPSVACEDTTGRALPCIVYTTYPAQVECGPAAPESVVLKPVSYDEERKLDRLYTDLYDAAVRLTYDRYLWPNELNLQHRRDLVKAYRELERRGLLVTGEADEPKKRKHRKRKVDVPCAPDVF